MAFLEDLAYQITRGAVRAYFDVIREQPRAVKEKADASDQDRVDSFRSAVDGLPGNQQGPSDTGRTDTAPIKPGL